mmetsp:Transcript_3577/g.8777  ORF Transcript_3577/g.8777 Transcript_3577/m.8777 type:complete len:85 (-) Transcript_3577:579-833(-)
MSGMQAVFIQVIILQGCQTFIHFEKSASSTNWTCILNHNTELEGSTVAISFTIHQTMNDSSHFTLAKFSLTKSQLTSLSRNPAI